MGQFSVEILDLPGSLLSGNQHFSYYPEPKTASEHFNREYGFCHFRGVISEDIYNMELSQTAMESGAIKSLLLQEGEICIRHQLAEVDRIIHDNMASKE